MVLIDAGWNNCGSGKSYDSDSGHHITVGNRSGLVVALHHMSRRWAKCEVGKTQDKEVPQDPKFCHAITPDPPRAWRPTEH
jgi:hypothetical protein